jgi:hypothetical protein
MESVSSFILDFLNLWKNDEVFLFSSHPLYDIFAIHASTNKNTTSIVKTGHKRCRCLTKSQRTAESFWYLVNGILKRTHNYCMLIMHLKNLIFGEAW